jgi:hypothetical protein
MTNETDSHDYRSEEERREANRPDIGGPDMHESFQLRSQEFHERFRVTLKSAIERYVIPDIWNLSKDERGSFFKGLQRALLERLRYRGLREETQRNPDEEFTDGELQGAWQDVLTWRQSQEGKEHRSEENMDSLYKTVKKDVLQGLRVESERLICENATMDAYIESGKLPSDEYLAAKPLLHALYAEQIEKLGEFFHVDRVVEAWEEAKRLYIQHMIEANKRAAESGAETANSKLNADAPKQREQRGMKEGTSTRVREMHRLLKKGLSQRQAKNLSRCDPSTYYRWCLETTGEEPIEPYR